MDFKINLIFLIKPFFLHEAVRSSRPEVFLVKDVLKICTKVTGEQSSRSVISIKLQSKFIKHRNQTSAWLFLCKFAAYF